MTFPQILCESAQGQQEGIFKGQDGKKSVLAFAIRGCVPGKYDLCNSPATLSI
jgi:hypothetical protein